MPRLPRSRAYRKKPSGPRRRPAMRRRYRRQNKGSLFLMRKMPESILSNTALGVITLSSGPLAPCISVGTPISTGISAFYDVPFSFNFRLSQLVSATDITQISDRYKIVGAYVRINHTGAGFNTTPGGVASSAPHNKPWVQHYTDHDDNVVPTVFQVLEHMGTKTKTFKNENSYIAMKCRPVPQEDVTGGFLVPTRPQFINSANPAVDHYGLKGCFKNLWLPAIADGTTQLRIDVALAVVAKDFQ